MIQLFGLVLGLAGEVDAQAAEGVLVHVGEDDRGVGLAARSFFSWAMASSAVGLVAAQMDRAMRISSVCSRGFTLPRWVVFSFWMGSMTMGEMRWMSLEMPPRAFKALSRQAELAPSREEVLPVTMRHPAAGWPRRAGRFPRRALRPGR